MQSTLVLRTALVVVAALSFGCKLNGVPSAEVPADSGLALAPIQVKAAPGAPKVFTSQPKITSTSSMAAQDGLSHVQAKVVINDETPGIARRSLLALPGAWSDAVVTLFSSTANTAFSTGIHTQTIPFISFSGSPLTSATTFPPLRPATDYAAKVFLRNDNAGALVNPRLAGSAAQAGVTLNAGANTLTFTVAVNGQESSYSVTAGTSLYNNIVTGGNIVKGDRVDLTTGVANNQAGVDHLDIVISGAAYGGGSSILGRITNPAAFQTFQWNTSVNAGAPGTFLAGTLVGGAGTATVAGSIDIKAYHVNDLTTPVAISSIPVNIYGTPTVSVAVQ